jgi:hypothetical protein
MGQLVRTLGSQLKDAFQGALGLAAHDLPPTRSHRSLIVEKVSRNAVAELVNQARSHPQRGDLGSANPAYVALAELSQHSGIDGLALGLRHETGELTFLDLYMSLEEVSRRGGAYVDRARNKMLWRQLKKLVSLQVERNMLGPRKRLISPEEMRDEPEENEGDEVLERLK